jgi:hypothetical protein
MIDVKMANPLNLDSLANVAGLANLDSLANVSNLDKLSHLSPRLLGKDTIIVVI